MRLFKLRGKAHRLGFLILEHGTGFEITNGGTPKTEQKWIVDSLEEVENVLNQIRAKTLNRLSDEEADEWDKDWDQFVLKETKDE
jgi:hypothetical protein